MIDVVILGTGNVAFHLYKAFKAARDIRIVQVYNHRKEGLSFFSKEVDTTTELDQLKKADVYLLALRDDAIAATASRIKNNTGLVVHTSGSAGMDVLGKGRTGVLYPLQTFSKEQSLDYSQIPFCLEAAESQDLEILKKLAVAVSGQFYEIDSLSRRNLHLAAVFACNFVNHLYAIGEMICQENGLPFEILLPLIRQTAEKVQADPPSRVQTGPAIRNDRTTINAHLELLRNPEHQELYRQLTHSIQAFYGKKL